MLQQAAQISRSHLREIDRENDEKIAAHDFETRIYSRERACHTYLVRNESNICGQIGTRKPRPKHFLWLQRLQGLPLPTPQWNLGARQFEEGLVVAHARRLTSRQQRR